MMEPSEKSLNSPTSTVETKRADVLGAFSPHSAMRSDHLNAVSLGRSTIQSVAVIGFVADQPRRKHVEEAVPRTPSTSWLSCGGALSVLTP